MVESILSMHELIGPLPPKQTDIQTDRGDEKKRKRGEMEGVGKREGEKKREDSQFASHLMLPTVQCYPSDNIGQGTFDHRLRM